MVNTRQPVSFFESLARGRPTASLGQPDLAAPDAERRAMESAFGLGHGTHTASPAPQQPASGAGLSPCLGLLAVEPGNRPIRLQLPNTAVPQ